MNASRAQLVRELIRPALAAGEIVLCDRFYHSTIAYQGYGRQLDLKQVEVIIDVAVGDTRPDLTLFLHVPHEVSEQRRLARQPTLPLHLQRDRIEEAGQSFFERVAKGYEALVSTEPRRVKRIDADGTVEKVQASIWAYVQPLLGV